MGSRVSWQEHLSMRKAFVWPYLDAEGLSGLEIGALQQPFAVPETVHVRYVDSKTLAELRASYPELASVSLVAPDIVDHVETLETVPSASVDFVLASHVIEHAEQPILAIENMLRVTREGGVVVLVAPMKCETFDRPRPLTSLTHLLDEYRDATVVRANHMEHHREFMWASQLNAVSSAAAAAASADGASVEDAAATGANAAALAAATTAVDEGGAGDLSAAHYAIHYHTFDQASFLELLTRLAEGVEGFAQSFVVKEYVAHKYEAIVVLQKVA